MVAQHYFSSDPSGDFRPRPVEVDLAGKTVTVETAAGIFSPAGVDKGTAILLEKVPQPRGETVLDIGTGWGPLTLALALKLPRAKVVGVEVNDRSARLTRSNAARLGLTGVEVHHPDEVDESLTFDTIWSNPPIRVGKQVLHTILRTWIPRLAPAGQAYLVVQKNLGADSLHRWLQQDLDRSYPGVFEVDRYDTAKGYRIIRVSRL